MDVVADADGNPDQGIRRFPNFEDKQEEGMEIQYDLVLGDRLCCIENQGVLSSSGKESSKGIPDEEDSQEKESGSSWRLMQYDSIAINVIVENKKGGINSCDIPYSDEIQKFNEDYLRLTSEAAAECKSSFLEDAMVVGTSAMIETDLDSIVNQYTDKFCNPMLMWGSFRRGFFRTTLPISFQFHHVQMDGGEAAGFLELLQVIMKIARL